MEYIYINELIDILLSLESLISGFIPNCDPGEVILDNLINNLYERINNTEIVHTTEHFNPSTDIKSNELIDRLLIINKGKI